MKKVKNPKKALFNYARYSAMAFQMIAIILAGVFGGKKLDQITHTKFPYFTVFLSIFAVFMAVYFAIKDLIKKTK